MNKTLLLVDGSNYLYRAYHSLPNLRNKYGKHTGAVYGIANMLRKLYRNYKPDYALCIFDTPGQKFRNKIFPSYKSNRKEMPCELKIQVETVYKMIPALGWPILPVQNIEADDAIGTLAKYATELKLNTLIATSDKDFAQLVNERVSIITTTNEIMDINGVIRKFGVSPLQMIDYLMLTGDKTDNIPGVKRIGPKIAAKLIKQYGSLENIILNSSKLSGIIGNSIQESIQQFPITRKLLTIHCDYQLPIQSNLQNLKFTQPNTLLLAELFEEMNFESLAK